MDRTMDDILITEGSDVLGRIVFGHAVADVMPALEGCAGNSPSLHVYMVYDAHVGRCADMIGETAAKCGNVEICGRYALDATEENKTMDTVLSMAGWLLGSGADRNAFVLAVGGGITTDMAGFAASIYKRGVRFAYVPTTLLSQVDAAIGGKTGVNYDSYKNMLGIIRQPEFTYICPEVLDTLPVRDFLSGASEMLKTFLIEDGGWYDRAVAFLSALNSTEDKHLFLRDNRSWMLDLIRAAASVKARVVSRDQFETGERRKLNLGHTFAHAIEKNARISGDDITHGEAVSMGLVMAAELSERTGLAQRGLVSRLVSGLEAAGLPVKCPYPVSRLVEAMSKDKKAEDGIIHFILLSAPGQVMIKDMTADRAAGLMA